MNRSNNYKVGSKDYSTSYQLICKKKPEYFHELRRLPKTSLIFIAVDKVSLHRIRRFDITCLFCSEDAAVYDLNFCYQREVWVLYADNMNFISAMQLAHTIQRLGAAKVSAILVNNYWIKEMVDV